MTFLWESGGPKSIDPNEHSKGFQATGILMPDQTPSKKLLGWRICSKHVQTINFLMDDLVGSCWSPWYFLGHRRLGVMYLILASLHGRWPLAPPALVDQRFRPNAYHLSCEGFEVLTRPGLRTNSFVGMVRLGFPPQKKCPQSKTSTKPTVVRGNFPRGWGRRGAAATTRAAP